jgi:uncharacterized protein (DUF983 family)
MASLWRGAKGSCPACGDGRCFRAFLKVADRCAACGEELHHQQADDFPAYLVIVIVGHVIVGLILAVEAAFAPPVWLQMAVWPILTLALALALLQPVKGAVVALQWTLGMHGFAQARRARDAVSGNS